MKFQPKKIDKKYNQIFLSLLRKYLDDDITDFGDDMQFYAIFKENVKDLNNLDEVDEKLINIGRTCFNFNKHKDTQVEMPKSIYNVIDDNFVFFTGIFTKEKYRNRGFGKQLVKFRLDDVRDKKIYTDVLKRSNLINFYLKNNFVIKVRNDKYLFMVYYK